MKKQSKAFILSTIIALGTILQPVSVIAADNINNVSVSENASGAYSDTKEDTYDSGKDDNSASITDESEKDIAYTSKDYIDKITNEYNVDDYSTEYGEMVSDDPAVYLKDGQTGYEDAIAYFESEYANGDYDNIEEIIISEPGKEDRGVTEVTFNGSYYVTDKNIILKRLNEIRKEACDQGIAGLKSSDYVPLKWSSDLEEIARIRAAEADLYESHTRPNGESCFSVKSQNNVSSYAENLAWNGDGLLYGIEQFYEEKYDYVNKTGRQVGHYLSIIDPNYKTVGMGCYKLNGKYWYGVAQEFGYSEPLSEVQDKTSGATKVTIECLNENVTGISIKNVKLPEVAVGSTIKLEARATVLYKRYSQIAVSGEVASGDCWLSSNTALATVSRDGTVYGVSPGYVDISVMTGHREAKINIEVYKPLDLSVDAKIEFADKSYAYTGYEIEPVVIVKVKENDSELKLTKDYIVKSYANNINAGSATVTIEGCGRNVGLLSADFIISKAAVSIYARDITVKKGSSLPTVYPFKSRGLLGNDEVITAPMVKCEAENTETLGEFEIEPYGAVIGNRATGTDCSSNYEIYYYSGTMTVAEAEVVFNVKYSANGTSYVIKVPEGELINPKDVCTRSGYEFEGFYKDSQYKTKWDITRDTVVENITLYPMWKKTIQTDFSVSVIEDVIYTGAALEPKVKVLDGLFELKEGKDYSVTYHNNVNVTGRVKNGDGIENFSSSLPYAYITGLNDYDGEIKINFNIVERAIDGSDGSKLAVAKYINQIESNAIDTLVVTGVTLGGKTLIYGPDYAVDITPLTAYDSSGNKLSDNVHYSNNRIDSGVTGSFNLVISGTGNYCGKLYGTVYVASSEKLLKNAKITLGKNLKKIKYSNSFHYFRASMRDSADSYTVTLNGVKLNPTCYSAYYVDIDSPGKATLVIEGKPELGYYGTKSVNFTIVGRPLTKGSVTVMNLTNKRYDGKAQLQDDLKLTYHDVDGNTELVYGQDYYLTYKNNVNRGTATVTVMPKVESGYSGKLALKFKIDAADISDRNYVQLEDSLLNVEIPYIKTGAKINDLIKLKNVKVLADSGQDNGIFANYLKEGKDYTVSYINNKEVSSGNYDAKPTAVITGKGNYSGKLYVDGWKIVKREFNATDANNGDLYVSNKAVAYNENKPDDFTYKPQLILKHGNATLKQGVDYNLIYHKNTEAELKAYYLSGNEGDKPYVEIVAADGSGYDFNGLKFWLPVYRSKISVAAADIKISGAEYNKNSKNNSTYPEINVVYNGKTLEALNDYTVGYSAVKVAGTGKGTATITFFGPEYGGTLKVKYDVKKRTIK